MIFEVVIIMSMMISIECKQSHFITGAGWKNEIKKCWSGGSDSHTYDFNVDTLQSVGLKYENVNSSTIVRVHGQLLLHTRLYGDESKSILGLTEYVEDRFYKRFSGTVETTAIAGWATQTVGYGITVTIHREGLIELKNDVYAGSWMAVSCALSKAYVMSIEIISTGFSENKCDSYECKSKCLIEYPNASPLDFEGCVLDTKGKPTHTCSCKTRNGVTMLSGLLSEWPMKIIHLIVILIMPKLLIFL